jgi:hypothetical protein
MADEIKCDRSTPDKPAAKPTLERMREWGHGSVGRGKDCYRASEPIVTIPEKIPPDCNACGNNEWFSKGLVTRDKNTGRVVDREADRKAK